MVKRSLSEGSYKSLSGTHYEFREGSWFREGVELSNPEVVRLGEYNVLFYDSLGQEGEVARSSGLERVTDE